MNVMNEIHPNILVLQKLDLVNFTKIGEVLAENFVWHYFNPELPDIEGDYIGIEGFIDFFKKIGGKTKDTFKVSPISATPAGDELVVTHVKDTMQFEGRQQEVDAVAVWRIVDGKITEGWDIPAINTVKFTPESN